MDPHCVGRDRATAVWHSLPYDTGLSKSRNTLVAMARTPFVFMTDDDFVLDWDSRLDALLEQALLQEADIVAGKIPEDMQLYVDFAGVISVADGALELKGGFLGNAGTCQRVEFVPNVFVGRRSKLMAISWDPDLKLGEHEDFFLRAKQKNAVVLTCLHIGMHHKQDKWYSPERKDGQASPARSDSWSGTAQARPHQADQLWQRRARSVADGEQAAIKAYTYNTTTIII